LDEPVQSSYGFIFFDNVGNHQFLDIYVPSEILAQLQLLPGSEVSAHGLESFESQKITLRSIKGLNPNLGTFLFSTRMRFPNRPEILKKFLGASAQRKIKFGTIRTQGLRGSNRADVLFEGGIEEISKMFDNAEAIRSHLEEAAAQADISGEVKEIHQIAGYADAVKGGITTSSYVLDIPLLRGEYGKIRLKTQGRPPNLPGGRNIPGIVRVQLMVARMTVEIDLSLLGHANYLLSFKTNDLPVGAPVTSTLLSKLAPNANIDAIDALEYAEYDPETMLGKKARNVGVIEMLITPQDGFDPKRAEDDLNAELRSMHWCPSDAKVEIVELDSLLRTKVSQRTSADDSGKNPSVPEDSQCWCFRKMLQNGRYAFLERLGKGANGVVNKYLDLTEGRFVAAKHILDPMDFRLEEIRALEHAKNIEKSPRLVRIFDSFYDGIQPVIVMECLDFTLADHESNHTDESKRATRPKHAMPRTLIEFAAMAVHLLEGLRDLHGHPGGPRFLHRDVKPSNIGLTLSHSGPTWRHIDLGLSRAFESSTDPLVTSRAVGTGWYMSPQASEHQNKPGDDIYSLGIVFFQLLNDWRHPGIIQRKKYTPLPEEVEEFAASIRNHTQPTIRGFPASGWNLGSPFRDEKLPPEASDRLREIVFKMMAFGYEDRYGSADQVLQDIAEWRRTWLRDPSSTHSS
jgi:hypothetical protein